MEQKKHIINNHGFGLGIGFFMINFWFWIGMRCEFLERIGMWITVTHGGCAVGF